MTARLSADYLVVGAGATGMAFTDTITSESDSSVVIIDRRHAPGGHWLDAYPFVRLHQPSACYGVASTPLGNGGSDTESPDEDFGERASGPEIVAYYDRVLRERLLPSGRVEFHPLSEYLGGRRFRSLLTGEEHEVDVRKVVDATRMQSEVPATTPPAFEIGDDVTWTPAGGLTDVVEPPEGYVIVGAGKTAQDACIWLLDNGVEPDSITWIRARDPWLTPRRYFQPGRGVPVTIDGYSRGIEVAATARNVPELLRRLDDEGLLVRIDPTVEPQTYRGATISDRELEKLRRIEDVVRLGYVRRIDQDQIVLDDGVIPTGPGRLHVHCSARGLSSAPVTPVFEPDRVLPQQIRLGMIPLCAAMVAHVEVVGDDDEEKNRLCAPLPMPDLAEDWRTLTLGMLHNDYRWLQDGDLARWMNECRLNVAAGTQELGDDPEVQAALSRFAIHASAAVQNLTAIA